MIRKYELHINRKNSENLEQNMSNPIYNKIFPAKIVENSL